MMHVSVVVSVYFGNHNIVPVERDSNHKNNKKKVAEKGSNKSRKYI